MGTHDMGWAERAIFGKIRFMNYNGCKRKFDLKAYVATWSNTPLKLDGTDKPMDFFPARGAGATPKKSPAAAAPAGTSSAKKHKVA